MQTSRTLVPHVVAYPNRVFRGRVSYVDPRIDAATRTAQVRIELANPGQIFKIGMYVDVAFGTLGVAERTMRSYPPTQRYGEDSKIIVGAEGGSRTRTTLRSTDFKSVASAIPPPRHVKSK